MRLMVKRIRECLRKTKCTPVSVVRRECDSIAELQNGI